MSNNFLSETLSWSAATMFELGFITSQEDWDEFSKLLNTSVQTWILDKLGAPVE